jgi:hypothetical protein
MLTLAILLRREITLACLRRLPIRIMRSSRKWGATR